LVFDEKRGRISRGYHFGRCGGFSTASSILHCSYLAGVSWVKDLLFLQKIIVMHKINFNAIIVESNDGWYVGQIEEMPEVISQGKTIEELQENLLDAFYLVIEVQRNKTLSLYEGKKIIRKKLNFA
jgi:predicted RNase H-like HicB family nuclease